MNIQEITSIKHELVERARALTSLKNRTAANACLVYDAQAIAWAQKSSNPIEAIFATSLVPDAQLQNYLENNIPCYRISDGIMKKMTEKNYVIPLVAIVHCTNQKPAYNDFIVVLDNVVDPGNIGTIARTAQAFGITTLVCTQKDSDIFARKTVDASRGTVFSLQWQSFENPLQTIQELHKKGYFVIATSPHAPQLQAHLELPEKPIALVVGNETAGISTDIENNADALIQIPMSSSIESLNVGIAAGISLYELKLKLVLTMLKKQIQASLGREINVTGKLIQQAFDKAIKAITNLSGLHIILLMILKCDEVISTEQISKDTALFGKELEEFLLPLLEKKLIEKKDAGITLTAQGELFLAQIWPTKEAIEQKILEGFSKQEEQQLREYLNRLQRNCYHIIDKSNENNT
ncbi:MAG: TrmH family RNA methyltransferase [Candidatus Babeliales bacterium]